MWLYSAFSRSKLQLFALIAVVVLLAPAAYAEASLQDGDLIFQTSRSVQSVAVQKATHSKYSHMGIVFLKDSKPYVFEAAGTVGSMPLDGWVARGVDHAYVIKRLKDSSLLDLKGINRLKDAAKVFDGKKYDLTFEWSDDRMYCSELVWKIYERGLGQQIGSLAKLRDFDLTSPEVKKIIRERYAGKPPLDEKVISPQAMFESPLLIEVPAK